MSTHAHRCLVAIFIAVIALVPLGQAASELLSGRLPQVLTVFQRLPSADNLKDYEDRLEEASVVVATVRPALQTFHHRLLGEPGGPVLAGRDGWLFYRPGVVASSERPAPHEATPQQALAAVRDLRDQLASRGIRLLVMPAPNKESIHPEPLTGRPATGAPAAADTRAFLAGCREHGIEVVDLFALFREQRNAVGDPLYLHQDTHWTPAAAELAARAVATRLHELGWIAPGATTYTYRAVTDERLGDLVGMLQAPGIAARFVPERSPARQVVGSDGMPYRAPPVGDVVVLGDSFMRIYDQDGPGAAGFIAHLAARLGRPVVGIVNDGGASTLVRQALARRARLLDHATVVIWEFVERDLRLGQEGWTPVRLPSVQ